MLTIGLTGTNASGKTCIVQFLKKSGFAYFSLSDVIRDELSHRGLEHSRENLRQVGNELRKEFGASILADRIKSKLPFDQPAVIDSIRNRYEVESLRELPDFHLLAIDAPIEVRFARAQKRGRNENATDIETFRHVENLERSNSETSQNLDQCMAMADFHIYNDGTLDELSKKLEAVIQTVRTS